MPVPAPPSRTLADLPAQVQGAVGLTDAQRRDRLSAIRTVARTLGAEPSELPLNIKLLRRRMEEISPEAHGISRARWNNVRSLFARCLEMATQVMPSKQAVRLSPAWRVLADSLPRSKRLRLGGLMKSLSARGVEPSAAALADLEPFRDEIIDNRLRSAPEKTWDGIVWAWNTCVRDMPQWPQVMIPREDRRTVYALDWSAFPPSLEADADEYIKRLSGETIDEEGPLRAMRPSTLANRAYQIRVAASALAASGTPTDAIGSLADLARLEPMKAILEHVLNRGEGGHQAAAYNLANFLKAIAQHWVKVEDGELVRIRRIVTRLAPKTRGLTAKNRGRLMPFNDDEQVRRFLDLPFEMAREVRARGRGTRVDAVAAQLAVAIAILQAVPLRMANLAALDLHENLVARGRRVFLCIPAETVKNQMPYEMELPAEVADLIAWYCTEHRDRLLSGPSTALFPGQDGTPKAPGALSAQISARVEQRLGFPVNPHLFRHIAAKLYLDRRPGEYALVSRLLNHQSVTTTMRAYTGAESASASRHFQSVVAGLRSAEPARPRRRAAR
jgi:integrase